MDNETGRPWDIDVATGLAFCGPFVIRFSVSDDGVMQIVFVETAGRTLEEQCALAGEAVAAIKNGILPA